jgi:hypothetical protein
MTHRSGLPIHCLEGSAGPLRLAPWVSKHKGYELHTPLPWNSWETPAPAEAGPKALQLCDHQKAHTHRFVFLYPAAVCPATLLST